MSLNLLWQRISAAAFFLLFLHSLASHAAEPDIKSLALDPTWLRLLHLPPGHINSEIKSEDFFLSATSPGTPLNELMAALDAFGKPWPSDPEQHARCKFPARYFWLAKKINLPSYYPIDPQCKKLAQWAKSDQLKSISLLLVSGYFGNPASTFGHVLLRLNTINQNESGHLLDLGFNFGALIPQNESTPAYVYKGLTGGYDAGFSDKYFYSHDLVYSNHEARDIWEYELDLSDEQRLLLTLHLYELAGKKFTYYFLTKNCAYRIAELLELVLDKNFTRSSSFWFTPIELFHQLHAHSKSAKPLYQSIKYVPSGEKILQTAFMAMEKSEQNLVRAGIAVLPDQLPKILENVNSEVRASVMDVLILHAQHQENSELPAPSKEVRERIAALLKYRSALPPAAFDFPTPLEKPSPAYYFPPANLGLGIVSDRGQLYKVIRGSAFDYASLTEHGLNGGELVVLDTEIAISKSGDARLDRLDVIRVSKRDAKLFYAEGLSDLSWRALIGFRRFGHLMGDRLRAQLGFGAGKSLTIAPGVLGYAMIDGALHSNPNAIAVMPHLGVMSNLWNAKLAIDIGYRIETATDRQAVMVEAGLHIPIAQKTEMRIAANKDIRTRWNVSVNYFF